MLIVWDSHILLITSLGVSQLLYCCQFCSKIGLSCMYQEVNHAVHISTERGRECDTWMFWSPSFLKPEYLVTLCCHHWVVHSLCFMQINQNSIKIVHIKHEVQPPAPSSWQWLWSSDYCAVVHFLSAYQSGHSPTPSAANCPLICPREQNHLHYLSIGGCSYRLLAGYCGVVGTKIDSPG